MANENDFKTPKIEKQCHLLGRMRGYPPDLGCEEGERVHSENHFGQAASLDLMERSNLWYRCIRGVKGFCKERIMSENESITLGYYVNVVRSVKICMMSKQ